MLALEPRHELGMALVPSVILDVGLLALDFPHMPHGVPVARGACLLQREIDEAPAQQHGRQRMLALQCRCRRIEQLIEIAVDLLDAGIDDAGRAIECRPIDQEGERGMNVGVALHLGERSALGLDVVEIAELLADKP